MAHKHTSEGIILYGFGNLIILCIVATILSHSSLSQFGYLNITGLLVGLLFLNIGILKNRQFYVDNYDEMNPRDIIRND